MVRREAVALGMTVQICGSNWLGFADHIAEQAASARQVADARPRVIVYPGCHELDQGRAVFAQDAEGGVPRTDDLARRIHDLLQHMIQVRSEEHTSELQSPYDIVCRLLLEKKKQEIPYT